ncbi:MAG: D-glycero-beta-D-manno-heptose 1-phosphate adenylyltransferase [Bacteroidia bacterium]|nr:D-glycero-beta-D-manno-heptose 1-phosphate adenylyltransferase [Bacteroidia bacterium]
MTDQFEIIKSKIYTKQSIEKVLAFWRFKNHKIVFTNGCFDIIHRGHIEYLAKAANFGNILIIGLNSDISVKKIKGENRPVQDENSRALILAALKFVDAVILFNEDTPYNLIKFIEPDFLVKGSDYKPDQIEGSDIVLAKGGEIVIIDFVTGFSTSDIILKISNK